jgi:hypothetical protein
MQQELLQDGEANLPLPQEVVRQLLQISLLFGIMVLKHMFTTALDKTI